MKRTDRLMAILIALQQRPETAQSLADKFEVSRRTVLRDMQSLSEMGVPLYAMAGPKGGFRLMEGFQLPPLQLDSQEALTVLFALRAMTKLADTPFNQARWTVTDKLKAILPKQTLTQIEPVLEHMEVEIPYRTVKAPHLSALLAYTAESKWLHVLYRSERHHRWLKLLPQRLYSAHGFWYCEAYSVVHEEARTFRVDRFEEIEVLAEEEGELSGRQAAQQKHADKQHVGDQSPPIRIVAKLTYRGALLAEQDVHIGERVKQSGDDQWELDFMCPGSERDWAIRFFYMLGPDAEVLSPEPLRDEVYRLASQVAGRYRSES
ncbi:WYL domain-containing protein [Paenibacillus hemerocallicola]|uniref:WYL domain-containing protein n=1 Tax=Paenibacillus hemerocallicola TaxID=1172614 RepID=A0A5C4SXD0_9BACL|nr:WYL domain-containing protein [Paenibacillus hemerocallicola]TNJ54250.1 WYL domain-containing protein [Paenibacillus hemerocallicola]